VRDPVLSEALQRLAAEAATRLTTLVASGEEIPFDVAEEAGESTLFYRYVPLTSRFIADHEEELRSLPSFGPACGAVNAAGVAAPYLEARGHPVPAAADERAAAMLVAFVTDLWDGSAEFSLDRSRLERALDVLDAEACDVHEADLLVAPVIGLQMPLSRLELPNGVSVVRADTMDAPLEAMRSEGMHRAAWEPQFLALVEQGDGVEGTAEAMRQLRDLISVLRLFKEGGVGLGPYVFAPTGEGRWRRIATGAPTPRAGGYRLSESEASELREFARRLEAEPDPDEALSWAINRFEMGCERPTALEGLSDHLLALRGGLEHESPFEAALAARVAALVADPEEQADARERIDRAFELERSLMVGATLRDGGEEDTATAIGLCAWIEDGVRSLLRDAALGDLRDNLAVAAGDELIVRGAATDETSAEQQGGTAEWDAIPESPEHAEAMEDADPLADGNAAPEPPVDDSDTRILEPVPAEGEEIRVTAWTDIEVAEGDRPGDAEEAGLEPNESEDAEEGNLAGRDWLSEVARDATLEWPASDAERRTGDRERIDTPRVRHLFPVPDDADWEIGELEYDRRRTGVR
jgi:hypothetical protein